MKTHEHLPTYILSILTILSCLIMPKAAISQDLKDFDNQAPHFRLKYPATFEALPSTSAETPLLLRHTGGGYPTFNVVVSPPSDVARLNDLSRRSSDLLESYRKVGITDVKIGNPAFETPKNLGTTALLVYSNSGTAYSSLVTIIPTATSTLTLTFIDTTAALEKSLPEWRVLLENFTYSDPAAQAESASGPVYTVGYIPVSIALLLILACWFIYHRQKR